MYRQNVPNIRTSDLTKRLRANFHNWQRVGTLTAIALVAAVSIARAESSEDYEKAIRPLMTEKCYGCHNAEKMKGDLDLKRFDDLDSVKDEPEVWKTVLEKVQAKEMPPKKAVALDPAQLVTMINFLGKLPKPEKPDCDQIASDKTVRFYRGYVMSRRLNRAEYINTIRDLFGLKRDLKLETLLPSDGSGGEGFDTTGDTLFTSSIHIENYIAAAKRITGGPAGPQGV